MKCDNCKKIIKGIPLKLIPWKWMDKDIYYFCNRKCVEEFGNKTEVLNGNIK